VVVGSQKGRDGSARGRAALVVCGVVAVGHEIVNAAASRQYGEGSIATSPPEPASAHGVVRRTHQVRLDIQKQIQDGA